MYEYDEECLQTFLNMQSQLFDEPVADDFEEAEAFLEDCMAVVLDSLKDVKKYLDGMGADVEGLSLIELEEDNRISQTLNHHLMYQSPELAQPIRMYALCNHHHFRMLPQTGCGFFGKCHVRDEEEFDRSLTLMQFHELLVVECRIGVFFAFPGCCIYDVTDVSTPFLR